MPCRVCPSVVLFFGLLCWSLGCVVFGLLPCCVCLSTVYPFQVLMINSSTFKKKKLKSRDLGWGISMANVLEEGPSFSHRGASS